MTDKIIPMPGTREPEAPTAPTAETAPKADPSYRVFCISDELVQSIDLITALKDIHKVRDLVGGMSTAMIILLDHIHEELQRISDELFELSPRIRETKTASRKG